MGPRKLLLFGTAVVLAGYIGFWLGEIKFEISFKNFKPAVVVNKQPVGQSAKADFELFWQVWDKVQTMYVERTEIEPQKLVYGAISGMVAAIGDPYTAYLSPAENKESKDDLGGTFEGVGIQLGFAGRQLAVVAPLEGTPAKAAGIKAGDLILHIKDEAKKIDRDTLGLSLPEAVKLIRGERGTKVELTLSRQELEKPWEVELIRDTILVKSVTLEILEKDGQKYAWLKLSRFGDKTQEEWTTELASINDQITSNNLKGIVLDLRNNPGGYLEGAVYLAGEFLPAGKVVVVQKYGDGRRTELKVERNGALLKAPLAVVVNKGSASAAEILAGALQDHKRAKIVGVTSFGKGSVQQPEDFADGSGIHVTVARWLRPNGDWIDGKGIKPDVAVEWENGETGGDWTKDPQLVRAVDLL